MKNQNLPYNLSFDTFVLYPTVKENKMVTRIMERDKELIVPRKPIHMIRKSCVNYGNSIQGTTNNSKRILNKSHKLPIVIAHHYVRPLIFLPTMSATSEHTVWIALHAIINYKGDNMGCTVYLENNRSIRVNVSEATLCRQHSLACLLEINVLAKQQKLNSALYYRVPAVDHASFPPSQNK